MQATTEALISETGTKEVIGKNSTNMALEASLTNVCRECTRLQITVNGRQAKRQA